MKLASVLALILGPVLAGTKAAAQDWDGFYFGLGASVNTYEQDFVNGRRIVTLNGETTLGGTDDASGSGAFLLAGKLWQRGNMVYGVDLDLGGGTSVIDVPGFDNSDPSSFCTPAPCAIGGAGGSLKTLGHLRAVVGRAGEGKVMGFLSLGVAAADVTVGNIYLAANVNGGLYGGPSDVPSGFPTQRVYGPSLGVGAQYAIRKGLSLRGEVVYDRFHVSRDGWAGIGFGFSGTDNGNVTIENGNSADGTRVDISSTNLRLALVWSF